MLIRFSLTAIVAMLVLAASASAQDDYALDYAVNSGVPGSGVVQQEAAAVGVDPLAASPATVYPLAPPTLAYNYYYPVPGTGQVPARLYLCPRPTPAHVGYTYITYQALAPHNFLYRHRAAYVSPYNGGVTITTVRWR
jgi:hypothetical protein